MERSVEARPATRARPAHGDVFGFPARSIDRKLTLRGNRSFSAKSLNVEANCCIEVGKGFVVRGPLANNGCVQTRRIGDKTVRVLFYDDLDLPGPVISSNPLPSASPAMP